MERHLFDQRPGGCLIIMPAVFQACLKMFSRRRDLHESKRRDPRQHSFPAQEITVGSDQ